MINDSTSKVMYITTIGKNITTEDLKGMEEDVFYKLYASKNWDGLSRDTVYGTYQVVRQNLLQNIHQEYSGKADISFPDATKELVKAEFVRVTVERNMMEYGEDTLVEYMTHVVTKVMEDGLKTFQEVDDNYDKRARSVANVLYSIDKDLEEYGRTGILYGNEVKYVKVELEKALDHAYTTKTWIKGFFLTKVSRELRGKIAESMLEEDSAKEGLFF